jgi:hypothetical protein
MRGALRRPLFLSIVFADACENCKLISQFIATPRKLVVSGLRELAAITARWPLSKNTQYFE